MSYALYCRISRDLTGEGTGVVRQEAECRKFAADNNIPIAKAFIDNDTSAFHGTPRPAFTAMMNELKAGKYEGIICWHTDRLYRRARDLEEIVDLVEGTNIQVRTVKAGDLDLNNATGRLVARMVASVSNYEVDHMIERQKLSHSSRAGEGVYRGGGMPYGYRLGNEPGTLQVDAEQSEIVREAAKRILAGESILSIVKSFNERGLKTQTGKHWRTSTVRRMMSNATVAGLSAYQGEIVGKGKWEAIISESDWRTVNAILADPKRRTNQGNVKTWQGSGVYLCGRCGGRMGTAKSRRKIGTNRSYRCRECFGVSRAVDDVDQMIDAIVLGFLSMPDNQLKIVDRESQGGDEFASLIEQQEHLSARKNELGTLFASGAIDAGQLSAGSAELKRQNEALGRRIEAARESSALVDLVLSGDDLAERWSALSADVRGEVIDELLVVTILPTDSGPKFKPESVRVEWK
ncbi:recombinase family protein [Corynebacterium casei]|uniref:recombinase family protein n=1 Tax=Corynebacterium casei TaxID=160386 RepID=UPI003FD6BFAD